MGKAEKAEKPTKEEVAAEKKAQREAKAEAKKLAAAEKKANKKPGVIATILLAIEQSKNPVSKADILERLKTDFPDKPEEGMKKTINAQLGGRVQPGRMEREKSVTFVITSDEENPKIKFYALAK